MRRKLVIIFIIFCLLLTGCTLKEKASETLNKVKSLNEVSEETKNRSVFPRNMWDYTGQDTLDILGIEGDNK